MAEEKKAKAATTRKKPEPRPAYIGLVFPNHPNMKKEDVVVRFTTRKVDTILKAVTDGNENVVVTQIKID